MIIVKIVILLKILAIGMSITCVVFEEEYLQHINSAVNAFDEDDRRQFDRILMFSKSFRRLQNIVLAFDILYFLMYAFITNKTLVNYFRLSFDKIATQKDSDYTNYFIDLFFNCIIKIFSLVLIIFFISKCKIEITYLIEKYANNATSIQYLEKADETRVTCFWLNISASAIFVLIFLGKAIQNKRTINKGRRRSVLEDFSHIRNS
jgi:hypothetical protein